jgi:acyl-CoA dehydrogenase
MDFTLPPVIEDFRRRYRAFVNDRILPIEADRARWDAHENIAEDALQALRAEAKKAGLWAPQMPAAARA